MDLLEYQGKQLFAKHGVAVPEGELAPTRRGGGRGGGADRLPLRDQGPGADRRPRQGGRDQDRRRPRRGDASTPRRSSAWTSAAPRRGPFQVDQVWVERRSDIAAEYYASVILDRGEKKLLAMVSAKGGMDIEAVAERTPRRWSSATSTRPRASTPAAARPIVADAGLAEDVRDQAAEVLAKLAEVGARGGRDPDRGQPADRHRRPRGRRPRRQGDDRRQRALPPRGPGRDRRRSADDPQEADGEGEGPHLREARRQRRHPRQRRRALHVDARRRRPGGRRAGQLPRRRRRLEGGGDRRRARGDHLRREGHRDPLQHLRRHHPLRRDRQGDRRRLRADRPRGAARRPPRRHQLRGGPEDPRRGRACRTCTRRRRCSARPSRSSSWRGAA